MRLSMRWACAMVLLSKAGSSDVFCLSPEAIISLKCPAPSSGAFKTVQVP